MRNGFRQEADEVKLTRASRNDNAEWKEAILPTVEQEATLSETTAAETATDNLIWQEVRKELMFQNLFGARKYCYWMSIVTLVLILAKAILTLLPANPYNPMAGFLASASMVLTIVPFIFWSIAYIFFYLGAMTPVLSNQKFPG